MKRRACAIAALLLAACATQTPSPSPEMNDARSLAAAESAFAAHSLREDMRAAFLAYFAADGVLVRGGWVNARDDLTPRKAPPIVLDWHPVFTEVAASGDMGLSTGPSKVTSKTDASAPPAWGQFVSIWKRDTGGPWRVAVDLGIQHPSSELWDAPLRTVDLASGPAPAGDTIEAAERMFNHDARIGAREAYLKHGAASLRIYRPGYPPVVDRDITRMSSVLPREIRQYTVEKSETARSNDLGYVRGAYVSSVGGPDGWFLRVWHREKGAWRIVADVSNPRAAQ